MSGAYFANQRAKQSSRVSHDTDLARALWEVGTALVDFQQTPKPHLGTKDQT